MNCMIEIVLTRPAKISLAHLRKNVTYAQLGSCVLIKCNHRVDQLRFEEFSGPSR
jgi:hypothetical protein